MITKRGSQDTANALEMHREEVRGGAATTDQCKTREEKGG